MTVFTSVLVANRGEIACRVIRTLRRLGIRSIAVFSDVDARALHVRLADAAVRLGPAPAIESYLAIDRVLDAAQRAGAAAIHPGYGFLSENAAFARACADAGLVFIGPPVDAIAAMGDKIAAKRLVAGRGVPVVPGVHEPGMDDAALLTAADEVGFPLLVKAAAGGGGRGMRVVHDAGALPGALAAARREAAGAFGNDALLLERFVERPHHIEVQVLADAHGGIVHLGERECSLQRRHQKIVEEAPSPAVDAGRRAEMGAAAVEAARACGYVNVGTVEFIVAPDGEFFFLEMNTRLQVEHPVTEAVYGLDLVEWQVRIAAGESLPWPQEDLVPDGHAVEARVYAEDPAAAFLPTGGRVLLADEPDAESVRVDSGILTGSEVTSYYDPLLAKVIAHGPDRSTALRRLDEALAGYALLGVVTNVAFLRALLADPDVQAGRLDTGLVERRLEALVQRDVPYDVLVAAALARLLALEPPPGAVVDPFDLPGGWRIGEPAWASWRLVTRDRTATVRVRGRARDAEVQVDDGPVQRAAAAWRPGGLETQLAGELRRYAYAEDGAVAWLGRAGHAWAVREEDRLQAARRAAPEQRAGPLVAPMPGTVRVVAVAEGDRVTAGQTLVVVEAMKMEHPVTAPVDGVVAKVAVREGEQVGMEQTLVVVDPTE